MAENEIYVDGTDLWNLGVVLAPNSYKSVLQWAQLKSVKSNDWAEYDYIEPDLESPTLEKRNVTLNFHAQGLSGYETFISYLKEHSLQTWNFADLGIILSLRIDSNSLSHISPKWQSFSVSFVDNAPYSPQYDVVDCSEYGGGGIDFDNYECAFFGITILTDTLKSIRQIGKIKERLLIQQQSTDGAWYDNNGIKQVSSTDFTVRCLMRAKNVATLINNYFAFLRFLIRPNVRNIFVGDTMEILECYYKSSTCNEFCKRLSSGAVGIAFDIIFTLTGKGLLRLIASDSMEHTLVSDDGVYLIP